MGNRMWEVVPQIQSDTTLAAFLAAAAVFALLALVGLAVAVVRLPRRQGRDLEVIEAGIPGLHASQLSGRVHDRVAEERVRQAGKRSRDNRKLLDRAIQGTKTVAICAFACVAVCVLLVVYRENATPVGPSPVAPDGGMPASGEQGDEAARSDPPVVADRADSPASAEPSEGDADESSEGSKIASDERSRGKEAPAPVEAAPPEDRPVEQTSVVIGKATEGPRWGIYNETNAEWKERTRKEWRAKMEEMEEAAERRRESPHRGFKPSHPDVRPPRSMPQDRVPPLFNGDRGRSASDIVDEMFAPYVSDNDEYEYVDPSGGLMPGPVEGESAPAPDGGYDGYYGSGGGLPPEHDFGPSVKERLDAIFGPSISGNYEYVIPRTSMPLPMGGGSPPPFDGAYGGGYGGVYDGYGGGYDSPPAPSG